VLQYIRLGARQEVQPGNVVGYRFGRGEYSTSSAWTGGNNMAKVAESFEAGNSAIFRVLWGEVSRKGPPLRVSSRFQDRWYPLGYPPVYKVQMRLSDVGFGPSTVADFLLSLRDESSSLSVRRLASLFPPRRFASRFGLLCCFCFSRDEYYMIPLNSNRRWCLLCSSLLRV
jgi:hypothetical protein